MFRGNPDIFQLILKDEKNLSPCIVCYSMNPRARNFMRDPITRIEWKISERPYHFEVPSNFKIGMFVEVGFELPNFQKTCVLEFIEGRGKKLRFELQEKRVLENENSLSDLRWLP